MDLTNMSRIESQFPHISHYLDAVAVVPYLTRGEIMLETSRCERLAESMKELLSD